MFLVAALGVAVASLFLSGCDDKKSAVLPKKVEPNKDGYQPPKEDPMDKYFYPKFGPGMKF
ncbi:MAG: hypothetical protein COV45_00995 [Deltaproteobacteria bacterium CG11_big_fil_rev_8_21_14_0_20_47_16]|nr:MAG: hypothetical protein COV45_00995 [Deltaproteobacteria bacterium CG11_big_fil_rev_8_21_14_0_20_47_16]